MENEMTAKIPSVRQSIREAQDALVDLGNEISKIVPPTSDQTKILETAARISTALDSAAHELSMAVCEAEAQLAKL
jgi:phage shock protein A